MPGDLIEQGFKGVNFVNLSFKIRIHPRNQRTKIHLGGLTADSADGASAEVTPIAQNPVSARQRAKNITKKTCGAGRAGANFPRNLTK